MTLTSKEHTVLWQLLRLCKYDQPGGTPLLGQTYWVQSVYRDKTAQHPRDRIEHYTVRTSAWTFRVTGEEYYSRSIEETIQVRVLRGRRSTIQTDLAALFMMVDWDAARGVVS